MMVYDGGKEVRKRAVQLDTRRVMFSCASSFLLNNGSKDPFLFLSFRFTDVRS